MMRKIFLPPIIFVLCLIGIWASNHYGLATHIWLPAPLHYAGWLFILAGLGLAAWARYLFLRHQTNILPYKKPDHMVQDGPFRYTRNPMYLGMFLVAFGMAILYGTTFSIIFPLIFFLIANRWYIPFEEAHMEDAFGEEFHLYKSRVRRWF
ncbi:isoprenylcysteine carboxylmethyltransferase family protein [Paremcibacter congregatus]|uniref:methyltransferase family protein n=1 Tax=Paremcibacter congregatus TaxID=2043170 RepID=UPI0030EED84A|tara:strand:+ start:155 stop:607 length:453 start_codon:yes stop_codon:yes gene_type:complete